MSQEIFERLSPEQQADIRTFADRLEKQNRSLNLVAPSTVSDLWERHVLDSLQLIPHIQALIPETGSVSALDIGTGGGLPAAPLAIAFAQTVNISMQALDSDQKKIAAIRLMTLGLLGSLKLHTGRVEQHKLQHDILLSRALASLNQLLGWSDICLKPGGTMVLLKGERFADEINDAKVNWNFTSSIHPSVTNPSAAILVISDISPKNP